MTNEEALKTIGRLRTGAKLDTLKNLEALMCAMDALGKQISVAPGIEKEGLMLIAKCPTCGTAYYSTFFKNELNVPEGHCRECGQRIMKVGKGVSIEPVLWVDYSISDNCACKEETWDDICIKCGKCGRQFDNDGRLIRGDGNDETRND